MTGQIASDNGAECDEDGDGVGVESGEKQGGEDTNEMNGSWSNPDNDEKPEQPVNQHGG